MNKSCKILVWLAATLLIQGTVYLYLDQILLAPTSSYHVTAGENVTVGKAYYSWDRHYMALVKDNAVEIYTPGNKLLRTINMGQQRVSLFKWLEDRNLALMAVEKDVPGGTQVTLTRINPASEGHESSAAIENLPRGSTMVDVVFSTATNVIYMQIQIAKNPDLYRVYRTDANHNLQRTYLTTTKIARIATLFDLDYLVYDDLPEGTVIARHTDGSWAVISPAVGKYRLVGADGNNIYIARLNTQGMATAIFKGGAKGDFTLYKTLPVPTDVRQVTVREAARPAN